MGVIRQPIGAIDHQITPPLLTPGRAYSTAHNRFLNLSHSFLYSVFLPSVLLLFLLPLLIIMSLRYAMSSLRNSSVASKQRLSQVERHFSSTTSTKREIQDAYILSASRTPTAKVCFLFFPLSIAKFLTFPV